MFSFLEKKVLFSRKKNIFYFYFKKIAGYPVTGQYHIWPNPYSMQFLIMKKNETDPVLAQTLKQTHRGVHAFG